MLLNQTPRASLRIASSSTQQARHASLMRRPKRPYTFTQLVTLSDGSTFVQRTTSPQPVYRSTKDVRNNPLWNPSSQKLLNIEEDEAGRLKRFRGRFGRGWDAEAVAGSEEVRFYFVWDSQRACFADMHNRRRDGEEALTPEESEDSLLDLISNYGNEAEADDKAAGKKEEVKSSGKGKGGQK
ncbi:unnamed protein product [Aureobasidium mustum]|uniref:Ribosomal protein bL31m N-terminal domain-containing protein n=1 Tax=Aureobasidium mustum TaxID=2773714 RepID=A0A9N8P8K6_9PEZI|nr:unnamed protein product [Aureobasidium mustum]